MAHFRLRLLGGFEVTTASTMPVAFSTKKSKALLAYLAAFPGRPHSREKLAGLLWGASGNARARISLRQTLTRLRKSLLHSRHPSILVEGDILRVDPASVDVDVQEFERLCEEGTPQALKRAVKLYRGEFLEDFHLREDSFEEWLSFERARLRERALDGMTILLDYYLDSDDCDDGIAVASRMLSIDPYREHAHRALMRLYVRQGRRQSALKQYLGCRDKLRAELGIGPERETESLYRQILDSAPPHQSPCVAPTRVSCERHDSRQTVPELLRQATVMCVELVGVQELSKEIDGEDLQTVLGRFFRTVTDTVQDNGGSIDHQTGCSATAVFGVPVAHGNDADRAIQTSMGICASIDRVGAQLRLPLAVRIGIDSGQLVSSRASPGVPSAQHVTGDPVEAARQLCDLANADDVLVTDGVFRAASAFLEIEETGALGTDAFKGATRIFRVRGIDSDRRSKPRAPLIGRRAELQQLTSALEACSEAGRGQAIYVRGEAGIGKTRLLEEFRDTAEARGYACHWVLVLDFGAGALQDPLSSSVCSLLGVANAADGESRTKAVERAFGEGLFAPDERVFVNDLLDLPQPAVLRSTYDAMDESTRIRGKQRVVTALIGRLCQRHPILLIVEDIHWAQPQFLGHLAGIVSTVAGCRTVLTMTARKESDPLDPAWQSAIRGSPMLTLDLGGLREQECRELAAIYVDPTREFAKSCVERAEGNPLFLEQLLQCGEGNEREDVPSSIRSLVLARLDRLSDTDKHALLTASVLGQRFSLEPLRYLLEDSSYTCANLVGHHFVRPDGDAFLFSHVLVKDAVYGSLFESRRRKLHRRAAEWYADVDSILRAQHLDRAHDEDAPRAYLSAALSQNKQYRYHRALELVRRGLELARERAEEFELLDFEGVLLRNLGSTEACIDTFRRALRTAENDVQRCRAWIGLAGGLRITGGSEEAFECLEFAEKVAAATGLDKALAMIHRIRGNLYFPLGELDRCLNEHELARRHARRAKSPEDEARALGGLADAEYARGRMRTAHRYFESCISRCRRHGYGRVEVAHLSMLAGTLRYLNRLEDSLSVGRDAVEGATKVGHRRAEMLARGMAGMTLFEMGEFAEARRFNDGALRIARRLESRGFQSVYLLSAARNLFAEGEWTVGMERLRRSLALSRDAAMTFIGPAVLSALALFTDDPEERTSALTEGERLLESGCVGHCHFWFYRDAMEISLKRQDWPAAERYAAAFETFTQPEPLPWAEFIMARARALTEWGRGRRDSELAAEIHRLVGEGERVKLRIALPELLRAQDTLNSEARVGH